MVPWPRLPIALLLCLALGLTVAACGGGDDEGDEGVEVLQDS